MRLDVLYDSTVPTRYDGVEPTRGLESVARRRWRISASCHFLICLPCLCVDLFPVLFCPVLSCTLFCLAAAVARKVYLRPGRGVGGLSKAFGTKARRGTMTNTHKPAATGIIRHVLQQLEALKVCTKGK